MPCMTKDAMSRIVFSKFRTSTAACAPLCVAKRNDAQYVNPMLAVAQNSSRRAVATPDAPAVRSLTPKLQMMMRNAV